MLYKNCATIFRSGAEHLSKPLRYYSDDPATRQKFPAFTLYTLHFTLKKFARLQIFLYLCTRKTIPGYFYKLIYNDFGIFVEKC